jgi:hypothetical protein
LRKKKIGEGRKEIMKHKVSIAFILIIAFIAAPIFTAIPVRALPTTWYVSTTGIDGLPNDGSFAKPWRTIQYAVNNAAAGDTIIVAAGIYDEAVLINKQLTLTGQPGAVIKPDNLTPKYDGTRRPAVYIDAVEGVTIQGFEIDGTNGLVTNYGIYGFNTNLTTIKNNKIHDMVNDAFDVAGVGIIVFGWDATVNNNMISGNTVYKTARMGIWVGGMRSSDNNWPISSGNTISYNEVYNTWQGPTSDGGGGIQVNGAKNTAIADNKVHDTKAAWFYVGIYVYGSSTHNSIQCNDVYNNKYGIVTWIGGGGDVVFGGADVPTSPATNTNNIYYNTGYGVYNIAAPPTLDATSNWWGSNNGPGSVGPGSGDHVTANVDYSSYRSTPAPCAPHFTVTVTSAHDSPSPPVGVNIEPPGWIITASVTTETVGGTRYVCIGRTGSGDATTGPGSTLTFTVTQDSIIIWNWKTQYYLTVTSAYDTPTGAGWYDSGQIATFSISPTATVGVVTYIFNRWSTSDPINGYAGSATSHSATMNNAITETAEWASPPSVGGEWAPITFQVMSPINAVQLVATWIALSLIAAASAFAVYRRWFKKHW